jgi:hypothetical protein
VPFVLSTSCLVILVAVCASAGQLPWLASAQTPPAKLPEDAATLTPLLLHASGRPSATPGAWRERREELRRLWLEYLGPFPEGRCDLRPEILSTETVDGVVRELVRLQVEPGCFMEAYLLRPATIERLAPGVVVLHSTVDYTIRQPAGLEGPESHHIGLHLARRGFVAVCPRCFIYDYGGTKWTDAVATLAQRHPGWRGMGKMAWDASRAADYLVSLPFVDARRLGCIGHSLGAKEALFAAAFDDRFIATVSSEGGIGLGFSNWEAEYYLGKPIREPGFPRENHEVLALVAPRAFLLIGGGSADGARSWPFIEAVLPIYRLLGSPDHVGMVDHGEGHAFPELAQERAYQWLEHFLASQ